MNWLKANKKGIILLAAAIAAMVALTLIIQGQREDRGFIVGECVKGESRTEAVQWHRSSAPIPIRIMEDSASWSVPLEDAFFFWKRAANFEIVRSGSPLKPLEEATDPVIIVEVISNGSFDEEHPGKTKLLWDRTCRIRRAHITVDGLVLDEKRQKVIMRHELGHALGLDHDTYEDSVMYPGGKPMRWGMDEVTIRDRELLKQTYGPARVRTATTALTSSTSTSS